MTDQKKNHKQPLSRVRKKQLEQKNEEQRLERSPAKNFEKYYTVIIGILVFILAVLLIYIFAFARSGDETEGDPSNQAQESQVQESQVQESSQDTNNQNGDQETSPEAAESNGEEYTGESSNLGDVVSQDQAAHDPNYQVNYNDGSQDRIEIAQVVGSVTGLNPNQMIEWWIGNNGPGRVQATVSSADNTEHYRVDLQYGDGSWTATNVEELASPPQ